MGYFGEGMMKSKPVVGTLEVILCARLKSLIKKKKKFQPGTGVQDL